MRKMFSFFKQPKVLAATALFLVLNKIRIVGPTTKRHRLDDKVIIVTGSSDGIGKETARQLLEDGATVVLANRDKKKTQKLLDELSESDNKRAIFKQLDLSSFESVNNFTEDFKRDFNRLDILINNAGAIFTEYKLTNDKIERTLQTNTLSPIVLTDNLIDILSKSNGRIINVASMNHAFWKKDFDFYDKLDLKSYDYNKSSYSGLSQYNFTKIGNVYYTKYLAESLPKNVKVACLHPGVIITSIMNDLPLVNKLKPIFYPIAYLFTKSAKEGAQTTLNLVYCDDKDFVNGGYYDRNKAIPISSIADNPKNRTAYLKMCKWIIENYGQNNKITLKNLNI